VRNRHILQHHRKYYKLTDIMCSWNIW